MREGCVSKTALLLGVIMIGCILFRCVGPGGASSTLSAPRPVPPALAWFHAAKDAREKKDVALLLAMTKSANEWARDAGARQLRQMPLDRRTLPAFREMLWGANVGSQYEAMKGIYDGVKNEGMRVSPLPQLPGHKTYLQDPDNHTAKWRAWLSENYRIIRDFIQARDDREPEGAKKVFGVDKTEERLVFHLSNKQK